MWVSLPCYVQQCCSRRSFASNIHLIIGQRWYPRDGFCIYVFADYSWLLIGVFHCGVNILLVVQWCYVQRYIAAKGGLPRKERASWSTTAMFLVRISAATLTLLSAPHKLLLTRFLFSSQAIRISTPFSFAVAKAMSWATYALPTLVYSILMLLVFSLLYWLFGYVQLWSRAQSL